MKKIKVLQFPIANSQGGITHYAIQNWKWMDKSKFQCDFATMSKFIDFEKEILATGSRVFYISCYAEENQKQFVKEFNEILNQGYDVVHIHTKQWKSLVVEELCKKHHVEKVIVHAHNTGIDTLDFIRREKEEKQHELIKNTFDETMATHFFACSKKAADFLFGERIPSSKIEITPNAIELDKFSYKEDVRNQYREKYGLRDCFVIGHVGRFAYQKNHRFLIEMFYKALQRIDNARLVLLGEGELFSEVQIHVKELKIEDKVLFLGRKSDVENWYQAMDAFCLPSRFEGLGMVLIEAETAGLKCITSVDVPVETYITENIKYLPLEVSKWIEELINCAKGYQRKNENEKIRAAGYDIAERIKVIEKIYQE